MPGDDINGRFPATGTTLIEALRSGESSRRAHARETLANAYWNPIYKYLRLHHRLEPVDAEDIAQSFFVDVALADRLSTFNAEKARLRTFIRRCVDNYVIDSHRRRLALKRGGGATKISTDSTEDGALAEAELAKSGHGTIDPEQLFHREWLRRILSLARAELASSLTERGRDVHLAVFEALFDRDPTPSHSDVASELGITNVDVQNRIAYAKRQFRQIVTRLLGELTMNSDELAAELSELSALSTSK